MRWKDWYAQVLDAYYLLRQQCEKVVVIGHSMGGLLVALLAASHPVDAIVIAGSPIVPFGGLVPYSKLIDPLMPYTSHPSERELNRIIEREQQQRGEPVHSRVHYPRWSTRAVYEMQRLIRITPDHLPAITAPLLLLYAVQDTTAPPQHAAMTAALAKKAPVEQHLLKQGAHIIFQDVGREEAFQVVADFVRRHAGI
jgi:carboxylesterase